MNEEKQGIEHIIGSAVMDKRYNVAIADEEIYSFLGAKVVSLFTAYIHPDDRENFIAALEKCDKVCDKYVTVRLKNFADRYWLTIIFIKPSTIDPDKFFELDIYDIVYLVREFKRLDEAYRKIAYTMQLMKPAITFDYTPQTGNITVFYDRDTIGYSGSIDNYYNYIVDNDMIDRLHISGLRKMIEDIKRCSAGVSCNLNLAVPSDENKIQPVFIRTAVLYDKDSATPSSVIGIMTAEEDAGFNIEKLYNNRSNLDPLTGLYNKAAIKEMATDALVNSHEVITYVMLDLDHFKDVNDNYGHMFGDEVILNVARIIKEIVGKKGFVGRVGGDEFFIVLKGIGSEIDELRPVLRSIRTQIEWAYKGRLGGIKLTASIGCASYPKDSDNYDELFKLADRCLYYAKTKGRNRFIIYTKALHGGLEEIMTVNNSIKITRTVSSLQMLEFVTDAVTRLNDWRESAISSVLKEMPNYFRVDQIMLYDLSTGELLYSVEPTEQCDDNICCYFNELKPAFRESNVLYYGDSLNLKIPYPGFYEYMQKNEYYSLIIYSIKDKGEITHLAVAYTKGRYEKWSDAIINFMSIIFKTIGDKILNE